MSNPIFSLISSVFKPAADLIDKLHTSDAEKLEARNALFTVQTQLSLKLLEYEGKLLDAQASVINSEAQGQSWMQRNWRPITMLTFLALVTLDSFGVLAYRLSDEAWTLLQIGLGGYVVGRSAEKIMPKVVETMKGKK